jgi:hypothetical protein
VVHPKPGGAMKYLCLIYENEKGWETMPPAESEAIMGEYFGFTDEIRKNGKYVAGEALQPTATATTVRVRNGKVSTTDGPFAETKEQLLGFYIVEAETMDEALVIGKELAGASGSAGAFEIRPLIYYR